MADSSFLLFRSLQEFSRSMAEVKEYMGVTDKGITHNGMNQKLIEGCEKVSSEN